MITKARLLAALNVAKHAQADVDAAHAETAAAKAETATVQALLDIANADLADEQAKNTSLQVSLAAVSDERDSFKADHETLADPEVNAIVDELAPEIPAEPVV